MLQKQNVNILLLFYILGGVIASGITFISVPLGIHFLGTDKFAQLSLWALFLIVAQIFDFGLSQSTIRQSNTVDTETDKIAIIQKNNQVLMVIIAILIMLSLAVPKPSGEIYSKIAISDWIILKIAIVINIKIIFNQFVFVILNRQIYYTILQILLSIVRFIIPIFVYTQFDNFTAVTIFFLISSVLMLIVTDITIGISSFSLFSVRDLKASIAANFRWSILLYMSAIVSTMLAISDRFIASNLLNSDDYTTYFGTFALASAVNIAILPFYRIFIAGMKTGYLGYNRANSLRITSIQSYICLLTVTSLLMFSSEMYKLLGVDFELNIYLLFTLSFSLWGAANGWILATDIMLSRKPTIQAWLILSAITLYFLYLLTQSSISLLDLASLWVIHGVIQTFICPIWIKDSFGWKYYLIWIKHVVVIPVVFVSPIFLLSYIGLSSSFMLSAILFAASSLCLFFIVTKRSLFHRKLILVRSARPSDHLDQQ